MSDTTRSPGELPVFHLHREVLADDPNPLVTPITDKGLGMNMKGYLRAAIQLVPKDGDNPTAQVMYWCEEAGQFVYNNYVTSYGGAGVDIPNQVNLDVYSGIIFVVVISGAGTGSTKILVAGI